MRSFLLQTAAVTFINVKSIPQRFWLSLSTVVAIALVVMVLLSFLAMANGFQRTLSGAGADDVAIVLRGGSQAEINSTVSREQVRLIEDGPGIIRGTDGKPLVSPELYLVVDGIKRTTGTKANMPLRGIGPQGPAIRKGIALVEGRMFNPGCERGRGRQGAGRASSQGFELGQDGHVWHQPLDGGRRLRRPTAACSNRRSGRTFRWCRACSTATTIFQTVRARLESPAALAALKDYVDNDPRLKLDVKSEAAYFAEQSSQTSDLIQKLGWPLAIAMAFGALAGALNTMYSSVAARTVEIATLRAIGFGGIPAFIGTMVESLILAAVGGVIGALATYLIFDGFTTSTLGASFTQVVFSFKLSAGLIVQGVTLALIVGVCRRPVSRDPCSTPADRRRAARITIAAGCVAARRTRRRLTRGDCFCRAVWPASAGGESS